MQSKFYLFISAGVVVTAIAGMGFAIYQAGTPDSPPTPTTPAIVTPDPNAPTSNPVSTATPPTTGTGTPVSPGNPVNPTPSPGPGSPTPNPTSGSPVASRPEKCVITMAIVSDPNPPLNVRSAPRVAPENVLATLNNGAFVSVVSEQDGWFQITTPVEGWISKQQTQSTCNQKVQRLQIATDQPQVVSDRFVGTGSHQYLVTATQGQTLTLTSTQGPLPQVMTPDGQPLNAEGAATNATNWSGKLPVSGEYVLMMDSNFKGYEYGFSVQIQ